MHVFPVLFTIIIINNHTFSFDVKKHHAPKSQSKRFVKTFYEKRKESAAFLSWMNDLFRSMNIVSIALKRVISEK